MQQLDHDTTLVHLLLEHTAFGFSFQEARFTLPCQLVERSPTLLLGLTMAQRSHQALPCSDGLWPIFRDLRFDHLFGNLEQVGAAGIFPGFDLLQDVLRTDDEQCDLIVERITQGIVLPLFEACSKARAKHSEITRITMFAVLEIWVSHPFASSATVLVAAQAALVVVTLAWAVIGLCSTVDWTIETLSTFQCHQFFCAGRLVLLFDSASSHDSSFQPFIGLLRVHGVTFRRYLSQCS